MRFRPQKIKVLALIGLLISLFATACTANNPNLEATVAAQSTWIAHLSTQVGEQVETNRLQWDSISAMATQMPPAVQIVTPVTAGATIIPTEIIPQVPIQSVYPPGARSELPEVDAVIEAVLNGTLEDRLSLVQLSQTACTTSEGLGGPPQCEAGESEGTLVQAFPVAYSEGVMVRPEGIANVLNFNVWGLLGVYTVPPDAYQTDVWPAGEYGVVFAPEDISAPYLIIFYVEDGKIVRLAFYNGEWDNASLLDRWEWVMPPPQG